MSNNTQFEKEQTAGVPSQGPIDLSDYTIPDSLSSGNYANYLQISHSHEEFFLDFVMATPGGVRLISRIIVSPEHMKRIEGALHNSISKYEKQFGNIEQKRERTK